MNKVNNMIKNVRSSIEKVRKEQSDKQKRFEKVSSEWGVKRTKKNKKSNW